MITPSVTGSETIFRHLFSGQRSQQLIKFNELQQEAIFVLLTPPKTPRQNRITGKRNGVQDFHKMGATGKSFIFGSIVRVLV